MLWARLVGRVGGVVGVGAGVGETFFEPILIVLLCGIRSEFVPERTMRYRDRLLFQAFLRARSHPRREAQGTEG